MQASDRTTTRVRSDHPPSVFSTGHHSTKIPARSLRSHSPPCLQNHRSPIRTVNHQHHNHPGGRQLQHEPFARTRPRGATMAFATWIAAGTRYAFIVHPSSTRIMSPIILRTSERRAIALARLPLASNSDARSRSLVHERSTSEGMLPSFGRRRRRTRRCAVHSPERHAEQGAAVLNETSLLARVNSTITSGKTRGLEPLH